jgi:catechol 2,3-dioxygenase-like lactoylglutathione lyase family enzyme
VIHHVGYVVPDLPRAIEWWTRTLGAGPFVVLEHIPFDEVTYEGSPAVYDHSSAFGSYGAILVELTVVHVASPGLNERLVGHGVGHVGMLTDDLDAYETDLPLFHTGAAALPGDPGALRARPGAHLGDSRNSSSRLIKPLAETKPPVSERVHRGPPK